jgi:hypothetical protein
MHVYIKKHKTDAPRITVLAVHSVRRNRVLKVNHFVFLNSRISRVVKTLVAISDDTELGYYNSFNKKIISEKHRYRPAENTYLTFLKRRKIEIGIILRINLYPQASAHPHCPMYR